VKEIVVGDGDDSETSVVGPLSHAVQRASGALLGQNSRMALAQMT
jgi:hypothetical protein